MVLKEMMSYVVVGRVALKEDWRGKDLALVQPLTLHLGKAMEERGVV